jgi:hypothetical protein
VLFAQYTRYALWREFEESASDRANGEVPFDPGAGVAHSCTCRTHPDAHTIFGTSYVSCLLAYVWWSLRISKITSVSPDGPPLHKGRAVRSAVTRIDDAVS